MRRQVARGDVAAAILHAGSVAAAFLHAGSIDAAVLHTTQALSVHKRYANERDVQKRHGNERRGPAAERYGERGGTASVTARHDATAWRDAVRIGSEKRPRAGTRGRLGSACGDTTLRVETRARGRTASWTTCWDTTARRF